MAAPNFPYYNTVDQIYNAEWSISKLARLELLRESIHTLWPHGHPTRLIHIVGTGGKGSTARFLELGFSCVGKTGALMSPHLFDYRERFSIGGEFVSQDDVTWAWEARVKPHCIRLALHNPRLAHTFQEVAILIALALYEKHEVEWAAVEASIGGRYDQTRALDVVATALTNVGTDHAHMLGKEQWQRVLDKAGSARPGVPFFTSDQDPANLEIIAGVCRAANAPLYRVDQAQVQALTERAGPLSADSLLGASFQKWNAALSLAVIQHLCPQVNEQRVIEKFASAQLLGRLWRVEDRLYADIAHNAEKISALAGELKGRFGNLGKILVVGLSGARSARKVFATLAGVAKVIIVTGASYKGQEPNKVRQEISSILSDTPTLVIDDAQQALHLAQSLQGENDVIILTGSTYMIDQALNPDPYLRSLNSSYGWRTAVELQAQGTVQLTLPTSPPLVNQY